MSKNPESKSPNIIQQRWQVDITHRRIVGGGAVFVSFVPDLEWDNEPMLPKDSCFKEWYFALLDLLPGGMDRKKMVTAGDKERKRNGGGTHKKPRGFSLQQHREFKEPPFVSLEDQ